MCFEKHGMSVLGYEQISSRLKSTFALPPKADILVAVTDFRFGPKADIREMRFTNISHTEILSLAHPAPAAVVCFS